MEAHQRAEKIIKEVNEKFHVGGQLLVYLQLRITEEILKAERKEVTKDEQSKSNL
jgi:hypothetical protein